MTSAATSSAARFNALNLRERLLLASVILTVLVLGWWNFHAQPTMKMFELQTMENDRLSTEVNATRATVKEIRNRIAAGVHKEKEQQLAKLQLRLEQVEESLRLKTIELIDPEDMFELMNRMIFRESNLTLINLKRREVRPAIAPEEGAQADDAGIYRHILEIKFSGKYADILSYMQSLEALDWKLIWDEAEIHSEDYPQITVKLVISTLSTQKEWVGV